MLDAALEGGFAYPAVNITSSQTLNGVLRGLAEARSDGIVQVTTGGAKYLGGGDMLAGARALAAMGPELAGPVPVLVALHTDHCPPDALDGFLRPLLEASAERNAPLFAPQMFDGSTRALEEDLRRSRELLDLAGRGRVV